MNPFDWRSVVLAKHAQHVALIHFPIALYLAAVVFDVAYACTRKDEFARVAYFNLTLAALAIVPTLLTGVAAWQWLLEGKRLKGILLYHVIAASATTVFILWSWWMHRRARRGGIADPLRWRVLLEFVGVFCVLLTGHLGGFLSGVNGGG